MSELFPNFEKCVICGRRIGYNVAEKLPSGLLRCSGCSIDASVAAQLAAVTAELAKVKGILESADEIWWLDMGTVQRRSDRFRVEKDGDKFQGIRKTGASQYFNTLHEALAFVRGEEAE